MAKCPEFCKYGNQMSRVIVSGRSQDSEIFLVTVSRLEIQCFFVAEDFQVIEVACLSRPLVVTLNNMRLLILSMTTKED